MARKKHERSEELARRLATMAGLGLTQRMAGHIEDISEDTIQRYYKEDWEKGKAQVHAQIAQKLYEKAMAGDTASLIFWAKTQMRWRETNHLDVTSSDRSMTPQMNEIVKINFDKFSAEELSEMSLAAFRGQSCEKIK